MQNILILAGGTGGHIVPGIALAQELQGRGFTAHLLTLNKNRNYSDLQGCPFPVHYYAAPPLPRRIFSIASILFMPRFLYALGQTLRLCRQLKIGLVSGMGGYPMLPGLVAARILHLPYCLCEQNAVAGRASRLFASKAEAFFINFPLTHKIRLASHKIHQIGSPLRPQFTQALQKRCKRAKFKLTKPWHILVLGGSQGALQINALALQILQATNTQFRWTIQCGEPHWQQFQYELRQRVPHPRQKHVKVIAYTTDIAQLYAQAHLLICRAGAGVLSEALCFGLPMLLIPYPYAAEGHQEANAAYLAQAGAALVFKQKHSHAEQVQQALLQLSQTPKRLLAMRQAAFALAMPQASENLGKFISHAPLRSNRPE